MIRLVLSIIFMAMTTLSFSAPIPSQIAYQGILTDAKGNPVTDSAGYAITFSLDTAETGGNAVWSESQTVTTKQGMFSVMLGSVSPLQAIAFDRQYWLGVKFSDGKSVGPKIKLATAPYATTAQDLSSKQLDYIYAGQQVIVDQWTKAMEKGQSEIIACAAQAQLLGSPALPNPDTLKYQLLYYISGVQSTSNANELTLQLNNKELAVVGTWSGATYRVPFKSAMWYSWEQFERQSACMFYDYDGLNLKVLQKNGTGTLSLWGVSINWVYVRKGVSYPSLF